MADKYNLRKHTRSLFPWFWQNTLNNELCDVLVEGCFQVVNSNTAKTESDGLLKAGYSIQRLSLEISLNDRFDKFDRRITVTNSVAVGSGYVYNKAEVIAPEQEVYTLNTAESGDDFFVFNNGETGATTTTNFVVDCPLSLEFYESQIKAWIDYVKITGTNYDITFT